jgi:hypothetical protein
MTILPLYIQVCLTDGNSLSGKCYWMRLYMNEYVYFLYFIEYICSTILWIYQKMTEKIEK